MAPEAAQECDLDAIDSCVCKEGFLLSGLECVKVDKCGCVDDDGAYRIVSSCQSKQCIPFNKSIMIFEIILQQMDRKPSKFTKYVYL